MLHTFYFTASNTTEKVVKAIADNLGMGAMHHNITSSKAIETTTLSDDDVTLFAAPVYAGRIPAIAVERFNNVRGNGQKCVAVVVYGNKCISCSRCIAVCPDKARYFGGLKYNAVAPLFLKKCSARREPEWFIPNP